MGQSLFNVGRKLTPEEWGELKAWRVANPAMKRVPGEAHESLERVFWRYNPRAKDGEHWCSKEQYSLWEEKHRERSRDSYRGLCPAGRRARLDRDRARTRERDRIRVATDHMFALRKRVRARMHAALRAVGLRKTSKTQQTLGCSFDEFARHLESFFLPGMAWGNRHLWHIDHTIPLASARDEAELLRLCHYSNTRPMWAADNFRKSDKIPLDLPA